MVLCGEIGKTEKMDFYSMTIFWDSPDSSQKNECKISPSALANNHLDYCKKLHLKQS